MPPLSALCSLLGLCTAAPMSQESGRRVVVESPGGAVESLPMAEFELADLDSRDVVFLRFEGGERAKLPPSPPPDRATLQLLGGDRVLGAIHGGDGDRLEVELAGGALLGLEVDALESVTFAGRVDDETRAGLGPAASGDLLFWLRPGDTLDRVPGTLVEFTTEGPRIEGGFGERVFPWDEVAALFIESLGGEPDEAPQAAKPGLRAGARVVVDLTDGGRLRGTLARLEARGCLLELGAADDVLLPIDTLAELVADDGRLRFLSELEPSAVEDGSPFGDDLGLVWRHRVDASVTGAPLRAGGRTWRRGLGVHAPSRLTYALDGSWKELRGACAVDDQVLLLSSRGSVVFRILVDGEERWASPIQRAGDAPLEFPAISLAGARELALEADMSTEFHVGDRADWLRPLLVRD